MMRLVRYWLKVRAIVSTFVRRQWTGNLDLAISFWVVGALVIVFSYALNAIAATGILGLRNMIAAPFFVLGFYSLGWVALIWWWVGTWRASARAGRRFLGRLWPVLSRFIICLSVVAQSYAGLTIGIPQLADASLAALDDPQLGLRGVRVIDAGRQLELYGAITRSTPAMLGEELNSHPDVTILRITSKGGRLGPASRVAEIVRRHHLSTFVQTECDSACTFVFLAGTRRSIVTGAHLGFHNPNFGGEEIRGNEIGRKEMKLAGLPGTFIDKVFSTPSTSIWYPTDDELKIFRVITEILPNDPLSSP
jgi:hypothetical protein